MPQQDSLKKFRLAAYDGAAEKAERSSRLHSRMSAAKAARLALLSAAVVVVIALVTATGAWWSTRGSMGLVKPIPEPLAASATPGHAQDAGGAPPDGGSETAEPNERSKGQDVSAPLYVHVAGHVGDPGLVRLRTGDRIADAIKAAGGAQADADLDRVNLAAKIADGEQIYVPAEGEMADAGGAGSGSGGRPSRAAGSAQETATAGTGSGTGQASGVVIVNINTGQAEELEKLPGVGPTKAQQIIDWRSEHGRFAAIEDLLEVPGIGPATLEQLRDRVQL